MGAMGGRNVVARINPLRYSIVKAEWLACTGQYVGLTSFTLAQVQLKGTIIFARHSITNNAGLPRLRIV